MRSAELLKSSGLEEYARDLRRGLQQLESYLSFEIVVPGTPDSAKAPTAKLVSQGVLAINAFVHDYLSVG